MAKGKRNRQRRKRKTSEALKRGLARLEELKARHERRIQRLNTKIAVQQEEIADAEAEEKEADRV